MNSRPPRGESALPAGSSFIIVGVLDHPATQLLIYQLLSGNVLYASVGLLVVAAVVRVGWQRAGRRWPRRVVAMCTALASVGVVISLGPLTLAWSGAIVALGVTAVAPLRSRRVRGWLAAGAAVLLVVAVVEAWRYERATPPAIEPGRPLVLFGDSISADVQADPAWPQQLADALGCPLTGYAQPGARLGTALATLDRLEAPIDNAFVIVLLGGNDILPAAPRARYASQLDELLTRLCSGGNDVVLVDLPAPPTHPWYAWTQRNLARQHGVHLAPRRLLASVLFTDPAATTDGIHLSQQGHDALARTFREYLSR